MSKLFKWKGKWYMKVDSPNSNACRGCCLAESKREIEGCPVGSSRGCPCVGQYSVLKELDPLHAVLMRVEEEQ